MPQIKISKIIRYLKRKFNKMAEESSKEKNQENNITKIYFFKGKEDILAEIKEEEKKSQNRNN